MSETKVWSSTKGTVTRVTDTGGSGQGDGGSERFFAGRNSPSGPIRNYKSYIQFTLDWSEVKSIVSATLSLYTDDGDGVIALPVGGDTPKVYISRLTSSFAEGNNADGVFDTSDYTAPSYTTSGQVSKLMSRVANAVNDIDITSIVKAWAPSTVAGGGHATNYGLAIRGSTTIKEKWGGWSEDAPNGALRPKITLIYQKANVAPAAPSTNLAPQGAVASIGAFEGDYVDPGDTLNRTRIEVYASSGARAGHSIDVNQISLTAHGYSVGQEVWFHSLTGGTGLYTTVPYYVRSIVDASHFKVSRSPGGTVTVISDPYSALTVGSPIWTTEKNATETEQTNAHFFVVPSDLDLVRNTTYKWRARVRDSAMAWSAFSALQSFSVSNDNPDAPTLTPADQTYDTLNGVLFRGGTFTDPNAGDTLLAYQIQLSTFPADDPNWDDADNILWDTGKVYVPSGATSWETPYGGTDLADDTYYWRARQWDQHDGVSDWAYTSIILSAPFDAEPGSQDSVQFDPNAPWRLRIREHKFNTLATGAITGVASTNLLTTVKNHGLTANRRVRFSSITGGSGLFTDRTYYVIASGLGAKTFRVSETFGGSQVDFTTNVTAAVLTGVTTRGPGTLIASIENAKSVGASIVYNSPGEAHWTLPVDHPFISVIEPKQVHYGIDFYTGDGWRETFAGLVDDFDATETSVVFMGIDYLALYDLTLDSRYFPADPNRSYALHGSYYQSKTLRTVVIDQLRLAKSWPNSPVGFIDIGSIATMNEEYTGWSTMQPTLSFVGGLIDSHKQGSGKRTRISVKRTGPDTYSVVVEDNPGVDRDNLRLRYGELVNGYRVLPFGTDWASVMHSVGRTREGTRVLYKSASAPGIDQAVWGRIARAVIVDNVSDEHDLVRRTKQLAIQAGKLGKNMALAIRSGVLKPMDGYNVMDAFPVQIVHGAVNTDAFGSGYWVCYAVTWEANDDASQTTTLTLMPREDSSSPDTDLIATQTISPQAEWQIGWAPPDPLKVTSKYWLDQSTGIVYIRDDLTAMTSGSATGEADDDLVTLAAHGFNANDRVVFKDLSPTAGTGITVDVVYFVSENGLVTDSFKVSDGVDDIDILLDFTATVRLVAREASGTA